MMLPEHKRTLNEHNRDLRRRDQRIVDDAAWDDISAAFGASMQHNVLIRVKLFDPFEEIILEGVVERVDQQLRRFKLDGEWFDMNLIERAVLAEEIDWLNY
ncbi:YolD-like family protein [Paenibacillus sp. OV219]|uniref:YolD-like family protein n=1 Tax=Paenibacillus sp. OV219 TaxID=1884377 RepID=UPI0015A5A2DC|nr:YolD-like family protein [Paenibacillus sp. OV219]